MNTGLFIRGGWAGSQDPRFGQNHTGLPSRFLCGSFFYRFRVGDRHTAYEWAMVLADQHPYPAYKLYGDVNAATIAGMWARERAVEDYEQAKAIYYTLKAEFDGRRLDPLRREWCIARPGIDRPDVFDLTRSVFGVDQVLPLVRRRGDTGWLIQKLLAAERVADQPDGRTAIETSAQAAPIGRVRPARRRGPEPVRRLAMQVKLRHQIASGKLTLDDLSGLKEASMAAEYGVSRDTARKARNNILSELGGQKPRQIPTIDK